MIHDCVFDNCKKGTACKACGFQLPRDYPSTPQRNCAASCKYFGPQQQKNGIPETLKCQCNGQETEIWHAVHECEVHGRCLPTFKGPFDEDHQMEAKLYHLCHGCEQRELASA